MRTLAVTLVCLAGCGGKTTLDVTVRTSAAFEPMRASVAKLRFDAAGADVWTHTETLGRPLRAVETMTYRAASTSGTLTLTIVAIGAGDLAIGCGRASTPLSSGQSGRLETISIEPGDCVPLQNLDMTVPGDGGDGGAIDAGGDLAGSPCPSNAFLCEDFEGTLAPRWTLKQEYGIATLSAAEKHRGTQALYVRTDDNPGDGGAVYPDVSATANVATAVDVYVRVWVRPRLSVSSTPLNSLVVPGAGAVGISDTNGNVYISAVNIMTPAESGPGMQSSKATFAPEQWNCLEWHLLSHKDDGGVADGEVRAWLNGTELDDAVMTGVYIPSASQIALGLYFLGPGGPVAQEAWFDDLVVAPTRIGCGP